MYHGGCIDFECTTMKLFLRCFNFVVLCLPYSAGGLYSGGSANMVESSLNIHGDEILFIGDHIYTDVNQSKVHLQWRTTLICRELEEEVSTIS